MIAQHTPPVCRRMCLMHFLYHEAFKVLLLTLSVKYYINSTKQKRLQFLSETFTERISQSEQ